MESARVAGLIFFDSSHIIAAERRGQTVLQMLEHVRASQGDIEIRLSVITIAELVHGAYRAKTSARQERRLAFIDRLSSDVPVYPVSLDIARLAGRIDGEQEVKLKRQRPAPRIDSSIIAAARSTRRGF
jgi:predicted nucleic acid-binding protein